MVSALCISVDLEAEKEKLVSLPWGLAVGFVPSLRGGRKRALYLQEQCLLLCLPMGEQIPCWRLQALPLPCRDLELLQMGLIWRREKGEFRDNPRLCYCAVWDFCRGRRECEQPGGDFAGFVLL